MDKKNKDEERAMQVYAALGVGFVCIIIGVPLWWKTTEVYRVQLPYSEITELYKSHTEYHVDFTVITFDENFSKRDLAVFGEKLKGELEDISADSSAKLSVTYRGNIRHSYEEEQIAYKKSNTIEELDIGLEKLKLVKESGKYSIILIPNESIIKAENGILGKKRTAFVGTKEDLDSLLPLIVHIIRELFVNEAAMAKTFLSAKGAVHQKADKESMRSLRSNPGYEVTFSLLNPQPDILGAHWDIQRGINVHLGELLKMFKDYGDITVKSQYLHYAGLGVRPEKVGEGFALSMDQLPHIINPIEAHLSSHVSNNPNLNFIVYVPTRDQSPLHIYETHGQKSATNAFLIPRWGGILIHNVDTPVNASLPAPVEIDMIKVMSVFASQLRLLLGINHQVSTIGVASQEPGNSIISHWEFDMWTRARTLENIASSSATLRSLAQLLEEISNIVINDNIGLQVEKAVKSINKAKQFLAQGKLKEAFFHSKDSMLSSETAFFDPSLLELLYFPEDQKFAIYIPLFLPISIPVVMSILQSIRWLTGKEKEKTL